MPALSKLRFELPLVVASLGLLSLLFLGDYLHPPAEHYLGGEDVTSFLLQGARLAQDEVRAGRLPLWNPYLASGQPLWANPEYGLLYPPNWIRLALPLNIAISYLAAFHIFWVGLGQYVWSRVHRFGIGASLVGAFTLAFCGFVTVRTAEGSPNLMATLAWLPWVMAAYELSLRRRTIKSALLVGLPLAMAVYAGHPETGYQTGLLVALRALAEIAWPTLPAASARERWGFPLRQLLIAGLAAAGLSAAQLLPTLELILLSVRSSASGYAFASEYSLPLAHLVSILVPNFFGEPVRLGYWGEDFHIEYMLYPGLLALLLVGAAVRFGGQERRVRIWLGLIALGLLLALGPAGGLHRLAYGVVPLFSLARAPARFAFWALFAVASLAAWAVDHLARHLSHRWGSRWSLALLSGAPAALSVVAFLFYTLGPREDARAYHIGSGLLAAGLFMGLSAALLYWRPKLSGRAFIGLAMLLTLADLWGYGVTQLRLAPEGRAVVWEAADILLGDPPAANPPRVLTFNMFPLYRNNALDVGLSSVRAYEQLAIGDYQTFINSVPDPRATTFNLLNAEFLLIPSDQAEWRAESSLTFIGQADNFDLYRRNAALPRAWIAPQTRVVPQLDQTLAAIHAPGFDGRAEALVRDGVGCAPGAGGAAVITAFTPSALTLATDGGGMLVLAETWYPGWKAELDGAPAPVHRVDGVLRGVCVPDGEHTVAFRFDPPIVKWGLGLTAVSAILMAAALVSWKEKAGQAS